MVMPGGGGILGMLIVPTCFRLSVSVFLVVMDIDFIPTPSSAWSGVWYIFPLRLV